MIFTLPISPNPCYTTAMQTPEIGKTVIHKGIKAIVVGYHNANLVLEAKDGERWIAETDACEVISGRKGRRGRNGA